MAATRLRSLLGQIEKLSGGPCERQGTDRQLLDDFSARRDEAAFAELVARHGPMVLRVCRRVLHHEQDAEDTFQATFLVLAQCCGSIRKREALADWLHGVAYRTAMNAKRSAARRRNHEARLRERTPPTPATPTWDDVQAILDDEIQRLPAVFRSAFVLCVLEGKTIAAVAVELGCKEGTVATRVMRARQRLQQQLARRGIKLAALLAAVCVAEGVAKAVPSALAQTVIRNGLLVAAGGSAAGVISPHVAALATGVTRAMFLQKAKIAVVVLLTLGLFAAGAGVLTQQLLKAEEKPSIVQPAIKPPAEPAKLAEDTVEVTGRVLDPDGKPVAKARLYQPWLLDEDSERPRYDAMSLGVTDAEGRFRVQLRRVSPVSRGPLQLLAAADGFGLNWVKLPKAEKPDEVTLRLVKDQVVRGRLVNTEGKPVGGVTVDILAMTPLADLLNVYQTNPEPPLSLLREPYMTLLTPLNKVLRVPATDKEGRFEITGLGAERAVMVEMKSATAVMPILMIATREGFDPKLLKTPKFSEKPFRHSVTPPPLFGPSFDGVALPSKSLEGTVREAGSHKPVAGAVVVGYSSSGSLVPFQTVVNVLPVQAVTDAKGHYRLTGLPKATRYSVSVIPGQMAPLFARFVHVDDDRPGLEALTCNVELERGVLVTGRVLDKATGKSVRSVVRCVPLPDNKEAAKLAEPYKFREVPNRWDDEGRFSLVTFPGPSVLMAVVGGQANQIDSAFINPYKQAEFDEVDRKRAKMQENPVSGVRTFKSADGGHILNHFNACKVVDLKENAGPVVCDLTVDPGKTLTINLQDPDGKPLVGVTADGVDALESKVGPLKTAACPVFALDPQRPRPLAFLHVERKLVALAMVRGDEKEPFTVRLTPASAATGRLRDRDGKAIAGAEVFPDYGETAAEHVAYRVSCSIPPPRSDKEGRFRLEGLVPGMKVHVEIHTNQGHFVEEATTERKPLQMGATQDLGDIHVKARTQ